jgi:hypothetical protein
VIRLLEDITVSNNPMQQISASVRRIEKHGLTIRRAEMNRFTLSVLEQFSSCLDHVGPDGVLGELDRRSEIKLWGSIKVILNSRLPNHKIWLSGR